MVPWVIISLVSTFPQIVPLLETLVPMVPLATVNCQMVPMLELRTEPFLTGVPRPVYKIVLFCEI